MCVGVGVSVFSFDIELFIRRKLNTLIQQPGHAFNFQNQVKKFDWISKVSNAPENKINQNDVSIDPCRPINKQTF